MRQTETLNEYIDRWAQEAATEMQKSIDEGVLLSVLVEGGWTKIEFHFTDNKQAVDIVNWCVENFKKNQWHRLQQYFVFRKKKDAEWFILRWS